MAKDLNLSVTLKAINKATGPLKKIMQGSRGVGRAMKETRSELKGLNDQQKQLTAFRDMSRQSRETRAALREKRQALERINKELTNATGPTRRLTQQQAKAQREVDKLSSEYRQQRNQVRDLSQSLPAAADGTRGIKAQQEALETQIRATTERLEHQRAALGRLADADVSGKFNAMSGEIKRLGRNTLLAGTLAAGSIFGVANSTATLGDDVGKTADKLGLTNAELQEFRYAGERSGVATSTLDSSMVAFTKRLGEATDGTGAAVKGYEALGLNAKKLADMPVADAMRQVADRMAQIENPTRRNAIAAQLYSRAGVGLVNMLKDGSEGLDDYARAARKTGYMLNDVATADSENFKDALLDTQLSIKGIKNTIGAELMPAVEAMMRDLSAWFAENREQVKAFAKAFGDNLKAAVPIITDIAKGTARLATGIGDVVSKLAGMVGGYDNLAMIAGGLFASKALISVIAFGASLVKAGGALLAFAKTLPMVATGVKVLAAAFAATPIGWIIAGITAVAGAAYLIYKHWGKIGPWFSKLWAGIKDKASAALAGVKAAFDAGISGVTALLVNWSPLGILWRGISTALSALGIELPKTLTGLGGALIDGLIGGIDAKWQTLKAKIDTMASNVGNWFKDVLGINSPSRVFEGFGGNIVDGIINGIGAMGGALREHVVGLASNIAGWMSDTVGSAVNIGKDVAKGLGDGISSGAGWAWRKVEELTGGTEDTARKDLDTHSPSRVFRNIGSDVAKGLGIGIQGDADGPLRQIRQLTSQLRNAGAGLMLGAGISTGAAANIDTNPVQLDIRPPLQPPASQAGGGLTIQGGINISIQAAPGMDEQALARLVNTQVERALQNAQAQAQAASRRNLHDND